MNFELSGTPNPGMHFSFFREKITALKPFSFVRFSDGEIEILRSRPLSISEGLVDWSKGSVKFDYPIHDYKSYVPERDVLLRTDLIESARYLNSGYYKGVVTGGNNAIEDRDFLVELNGGTTNNLSFADLFINEHYLQFLNQILPLLKMREDVYFVGNFRASVEALSVGWSKVSVPDNFFPNYTSVAQEIFDSLINVPSSSLILSSASSLSNILGHKLHVSRPDLTFIDVGTSLNHLIGLGRSSRAYHTQLEPWNLRTLRPKLLYRLFGGHRLKW
jgi:hypothetical protein